MIVPDPGDLQDLVRDLHRQATPWAPAGLGTRLDWGPPLETCHVLSAARLCGIAEHSPGDFVVRVGAGTPLLELQAELARHRQWLAVDLPPATMAADNAANSASAAGSIGGLVARGLAGGYRQRYLGIRDQLIGIRILRADGVAARAGGKVVKNVAGYDLMRLFTGSWGSLGLITELTLRTMPLPPVRAALLLQGPAAQLVDRVAVLLRSGLSPERLDLWSPALAAAAGLEAAPHLLIALGSVSPASLEAQIAVGRRAAGPLPCTTLDAEALAALLSGTRPEAGASRSAADPAAWLLRLAVTSSRAAELIDHPDLAGIAIDLAAASGLATAWAAANALTDAQVAELRRHCSGLGGYLTVLRQPAGSINAWEDAPSRPLIEAVKARLDPLGQLAPGRLPGVARPQRAGAPAS
ncbi:MAG: FAD-binding oxidoreductase [Cyanobium sp.]